MMGVDHNKGLKWVGASAVLIDYRCLKTLLIAVRRVFDIIYFK